MYKTVEIDNRSMITFSRLGSFGRLGNQLFQIAAVLGLAKNNNTNAKFNKWEYSKYFKNPIDDSGIDSSRFVKYSEKEFCYSPIPFLGDMDLVGYFQSDKYFSHCVDDILKHFEFVDSLDDGSIDPDTETCSIHIRRGDYVNLVGYHPLMGMEYYSKAIDSMRAKGSKKFYFFSDDIRWCKENFGLTDEYVYIEGNQDIKDLFLMSKCKNNIIANSSFSWWGAWLNRNGSKRVIAPSIWFGELSRDKNNTNDLYCKDWEIF